ncbi:hypothetical protein O181_056924 [Austropuccinia psidii MF-1]|uniref:Reverse transcriptase/retrotransposon-derived protein RNase H-like domain-containing protein n=1 Tax=Austropuccinia psidii MF-1 TaxID=1389203 RepID=A0A9Q3HW59_9BASI|nr:hypothetical protein [Austropuccinia psidii MF-1]
MSEHPEKIPLIILDSSESPSLFVTHHTKCMVELLSFPSFEWEFLVIDTPKGEDLILGFDFFNHINPSIDWRQWLIIRTILILQNLSLMAFHSAKSCAALVDEVFKEIQDVGEDNSVSSIHPFFWNIDLPPSSCHDSLEELWDEEEEPKEVETVIKVVPSVYHQYLDVFSKVKVEKLPPHQACDHHIDLEGCLPPAYTIAPILPHFDPSLPTIVDTDASDYALGAVLSQIYDSGKCSIVFDSRKLLPAELNYGIHDKELLGVI